MGIPFLNEIEKLINEHGSAKILHERIALAKDQYEAIEKELAASKQREIDLSSKIKSLVSENEQLNKRIDELNSEKQKGQVSTLNKIEENNGRKLA